MSAPAGDGGYKVGGGVDVFLTPGIQRHKGALIQVGKDTPTEPATKILKEPGSKTGINAERGKRVLD